MFDPRKILVPVDFSRHSDRALAVAVDICRRYGASLFLLHCYQLNPGSISPYGPVLPDAYRDDLKAAAGKRLEEWAANASSQDVEVTPVLSPLYPSEAIDQVLAEQGIDLIVIGTRGLTGLRHVLLGSVAERTVRTAACPVLSVKADGSDD
jgi:nucleotide-binding universal stress UspA family protein